MGKGLPSLSWLRLGEAIALTVLLALLGLSLAGVLGRWCFLCDLTVHFRVQYLIFALPLFAFFLWRQRRWAWLLSLFGLVLNLSLVVPWYWPQNASLALDSAPLRVMVSNIQGRKHRNYEDLLALVRQKQPDLLMLQETNRRWLDALEPLQNEWPYTLNQRNTHPTDVAIYSRLPLRAIAPPALAEVQEDVLVAEFERDGVMGVAIAIHPPPPITGTLFARRNQVLQQVSQYIQQLQDEQAPGFDHIILGGDFNITMWSTFYQQLARTTGLKNSRDGFGVLPTWPTQIPPLRIPIDHCLVSPNIPVLNVQSDRVMGADHLSLVTDLLF